MVPYNGNLDSIRKLMKNVGGEIYDDWESWDCEVDG